MYLQRSLCLCGSPRVMSAAAFALLNMTCQRGCSLQATLHKEKPGEHVLIISDSQLAICTTTGAWASRKHKLLVANNRKALARLREGGATVHFQHARAHTGHAINERADELALSGAQGMRMRDGRLYAPAIARGRALPADTVPD